MIFQTTRKIIGGRQIQNETVITLDDEIRIYPHIIREKFKDDDICPFSQESLNIITRWILENRNDYLSDDEGDTNGKKN